MARPGMAKARIRFDADVEAETILRDVMKRHNFGCTVRDELANRLSAIVIRVMAQKGIDAEVYAKVRD